jgi:hypothetical protein
MTCLCDVGKGYFARACERASGVMGCFEWFFFLGWTWDGVSEGGDDVVRPVVRFLLYMRTCSIIGHVCMS